MKIKTFPLKWILAVFSCSLMISIYGQVEINESYRHDIMEDIGHSDNLLYTFNAIPKVYGKQELTLYSAYAKKLNTILLEAKQGLEMIDCVSLGTNTLFYFDYNLSKKILLIMFDVNGNEIARKEFEYLKISDQHIVKISDSKFCLVSGVKFKKAGILVECFNAQLESQWKYEKSAEKSKYFLELSASNEAGKLAIVYAEKSQRHFMLILGAEGSELSNKELNEVELDRFNPYFLQFVSADDIILASDYGASSSDLHKYLPLGTSVKKFNVNGEEVQNERISFKDFYAKMIEGRQKELAGAELNPMLRVLDVIKKDGKPTLVCEGYTVKERTTQEVVTAGAGPTNVTLGVMSLFDFYLIDLNNVSDVKRVWKPSRSVALNSVSSMFSVRDFCSIMAKNNMFSLQFTDDNALFIKNMTQNFQYYNRIGFSDQYDAAETRKYWGTPVNDDYSAYGNEQLFYKPGIVDVLGINHSGFMETNETILLYHLHKPTGELQFTILKQK